MERTSEMSLGTILDRSRIAHLVKRERARYEERTQVSADRFRRAKFTLAGGVGSSYQSREPWPMFIERGRGSRVWDVDGNQYRDFLLGFGAMVSGHGHPVIAEAVAKRMRDGSHFSAPTDDMVAVSQQLAVLYRNPDSRHEQRRCRLARP